MADQAAERVSVVIVTYRSSADIEECLTAVQRAAKGCALEIVVVDNASPDDTVRLARAAAPQAAIIQEAVNRGFSHACHVGAQKATGDWLLFLNPDTVVAEDALTELVACARRQLSAGVVGGRFLHQDGSNDPRSCWRRPSIWSTFCFALGLSSLFPGNYVFDPEAARPWPSSDESDRRVAIVSGAFMLVRRSVWTALDGFDRNFFLYGEDADFCLRVAASGLSVIVTKRAVCCHFGGRSNSSVDKMIMLFTGKSSLVRRHFPPGLRRPGVALLLVGVFVRATTGRLVGRANAQRQGRPTQRAEDWRALWTARERWCRGWVVGG